MKNKGITLVSLVVTIIVMLILAGVSVAMLFGDNGILKNAGKAKEETIIKKYEEIISLAITEAHIKTEEVSDLEILKEVKEILLKDTEFKEATISGPDENEEKLKLVVKTKEGYIYYVYGDGIVKKEESGDIELDISLQDGDIKYTYTPSEWTNGEVKVKIEITKEEYKGYSIEYSLDGTKWTAYIEEIEVSKNNTTIISRLTNGIATIDESKYATGNVTNIDRLEPEEFTPTAKSTTNSIKVTAQATDKEATEEDGCSGIKEYRFSEDNGTTWTEWQESGEYTFEDLAQTTEYTIKVEAKDNAGNTTIGTITIGTGTIATASGATYTPTTWTNGKVTVTLPTKSGFTTRYTTDGTAPTKSSTAYSSAFTVSSNCTITYIYTDGTNIGGAGTANITNIDTTVPTISTALSSSSVTTNGFTLNMGVKDTSSGLSKIEWYYKLSTASSYTSATDTYTAMNGSTTGTTTAITKQKVITGLTSGTYNVYAKAYDVAGNSTQSSTINITLGTIATASGATYTPTTWTNGKVTVTLPTKSGFTTRYTTDGTAPTKSSTAYSSAFTVSSNCTITYIYTDGTNIGGAGTANITNIDTTIPTIGSISSAFSIVSGNTGTITISSIADTGGSRLSGIYINTSSTKPTATSVTWTSNTASSYKHSVTSAGTYYVWVKDKAGNVSSAKSCKVTTVTAIAKVGSTYYSSIANAISAISSSGTVTMVASTTESPTIPSGKTITLALNSKTITGSITNNGTLTINGSGTIKKTDEGNLLTNNGVVNLKSGTIQSTNTNYWTVNNKGTFNMSGGKISLTDTSASGGTGTALYSTGTVNMTGGTISSAAFGLASGAGTAKVTGGSITSNSERDTVIAQKSGTIILDSATITQNGTGRAIANNVEYGNCILYDTYPTGTIYGQVYRVTAGDSGYGLDVWGITSSATDVKFPTWTNSNGQDDITWESGTKSTKNGNTSWSYDIVRSMHNNETGTYITHVYWYNSAGTGTCVIEMSHTF